MKSVRVSELEQFKIQASVFEEVIKEHHSEECRSCLVTFSNRLHKKMFDSKKAREETTERVREVMREVLFGGVRV